MGGAVLVLRPGTGGANSGDLAALVSGVAAGLAVPFLRRARRHDGIWTILFWLMGTGTVVNLAVVGPHLVWPGASLATVALFASALLGVGGQFLLTMGYRYIDAARGSVVSSVRIVLGALLGVALFADPLEWTLVVGASLILLALAGASGVLERGALSPRISRE
jgi:drug/metabolite transporter (DMT)-like permease